MARPSNSKGPHSTRITRQRRERMNEALDHRTTGMSYREIAEEMRISVHTAYTYVRDALKEITREKAEQVLTLELKRYDDMLSIAYQQIVNGELAAIDRALAIMARIERLHGIEAPKAADGATETATMLNQLLAASIERLNSKDK